MNVTGLPRQTVWLTGWVVMDGAESCSTTTLNVQVLVKQALVAVQVTTVEPPLNALPLAGAQARSAPPVTVGAGYVTVVFALQVLLVTLAGQVIVGAIVTVSVATTLVTEPQALATSTE